MQPVSAVLIDDHPLFRKGLAELFEHDGRIRVLGIAGSLADARPFLAQKPDVLVMDLNLPDQDGIEAMRRLREEGVQIPVVALTMSDAEDDMAAVLRAGARGYLLKGANQADVVRAVHLVATGGAMFGPAVAQRLIEFFARPRPAGTPLAFPQLTDREHEILDLLAQGRPNATIAARLRISDKTVRNHVSNIFTKLAVADRAQAVVRAREAGLGGSTRPSPPRAADHGQQ